MNELRAHAVAVPSPPPLIPRMPGAAHEPPAIGQPSASANRRVVAPQPPLGLPPPEVKPARRVILEPWQTPTTIGPLRDLEHARAVTSELIEEAFPELRGVPIEVRVRPLGDAVANFESRPSIGSLLNPFAPIRYVVTIDPRVFRRRLPAHIAKAVLAHELSHTVYYVSGGFMGLLRALWSQLSPLAGIRFERATDLEAIRRGYGRGLLAYIGWLYPRLTETQRASKARKYLSPLEIRAAMLDVGRGALWDEWRAAWPLAH